MTRRDRFGLSCAVTTPFTKAMEIDLPLFVRHVQRLLASGCDSVTVFGTTGEGPTLGMQDRISVLSALQAAGIDLRTQVIGGVMANSPREADEQIQLLYDFDCRNVLLAPPFFFKGVSNEGLFAWVSERIQAAGGQARDIILYHIPQMTGVRYSIAIIEKLKRAFPKIVMGVKDSAGIWPETEALLKAHSDLAILVGDESHLAAAVRLGGEGAICGFANMVPQSMRIVAYEGKEHPDVDRLKRVMEGDHFLAVVKSVLAHQHKEPGWHFLRPPLVPVTKPVASGIVARYKAEFS